MTYFHLQLHELFFTVLLFYVCILFSFRQILCLLLQVHGSLLFGIRVWLWCPPVLICSGCSIFLNFNIFHEFCQFLLEHYEAIFLCTIVFFLFFLFRLFPKIYFSLVLLSKLSFCSIIFLLHPFLL